MGFYIRTLVAPCNGTKAYLQIPYFKVLNFPYSLRTYSLPASGLPECPNITLHYITLHYITLHYITLHYITLHYITLHYITSHYSTLHLLYYFTLPWYIAACTVYIIQTHGDPSSMITCLTFQLGDKDTENFPYHNNSFRTKTCDFVIKRLMLVVSCAGL